MTARWAATKVAVPSRLGPGGAAGTACGGVLPLLGCLLAVGGCLLVAVSLVAMPAPASVAAAPAIRVEHVGQAGIDRDGQRLACVAAVCQERRLAAPTRALVAFALQPARAAINAQRHAAEKTTGGRQNPGLPSSYPPPAPERFRAGTTAMPPLSPKLEEADGRGFASSRDRRDASPEMAATQWRRNGTGSCPCPIGVLTDGVPATTGSEDLVASTPSVAKGLPPWRGGS
jgi:hypothetical protein